jgi:predicted amidophosphoribosyltransferase
MCTDIKNMKNILILIKKIGYLLRVVIEIIFPKREEFGEREGSSDRNTLNTSTPTTYRCKPDIYANITYFMKYKDPLVKKRLWQFKYYLNPTSLLWCTYILYDELIAEASDRIDTIPFSRPILLLHCPSSTYFKGGKKFDHMKELTLMFGRLQNLSEPFFICCTHAILPNTSSQTGMLRAQHTGTRKERLEWAGQRFFISEKFENYLSEKLGEKYSSRTIYCIDDVVTTGASLGAISKLFQNKFNIYVKSFCLCH